MPSVTRSKPTATPTVDPEGACPFSRPTPPVTAGFTTNGAGRFGSWFFRRAHPKRRFGSAGVLRKGHLVRSAILGRLQPGSRALRERFRAWPSTVRSAARRPVSAAREPRPQRSAAPVRAQPAAGASHGERRRPSTAGLHAVHPVEQGRQGGLMAAFRTAIATTARRPARSARTARPSGPAAGSSFPGRFQSIPPAARWSAAASETRPVGSCDNLAAILRAARQLVRSGGQDHRLPGGHGGVRRDERGLRDVLSGAAPRARDRAGGAAATRRRRSRSI